MNKKEVQMRVLQGGRPLALNRFSWNENAKTFSSDEDGLVIDFSGINGCTFDTGGGCTFKTGYGCTFKTGGGCTFKTGYGCTFKTGGDCTFDTGSYCTFDTGSYCTFDTGGDCTFKTGDNCTFDTGGDCTFKTGDNCTFDTGRECTFYTGYGCTFDTGDNCTFNTGEKCVIVRRDVFEVIMSDGDEIRLYPYRMPGHLRKVDGVFYPDGDQSLGEHDVIDKVLVRIVSKRNVNGLEVMRVVVHGESKESYVVRNAAGLSAHGRTMAECKESLIYKIGDRDTSEYERHEWDTVLSFEEQVRMYRTITGSCESQTRAFAEKQERKDRTVLEVIELTEGQWGNDALKKFFNV